MQQRSAGSSGTQDKWEGKILYNQPYGISDTTASYVNGNPTTGTMGSIPPAAAIEYDQREIVAVIKWAYDHGYHDYAAALCQAPSNGDLTQLLKAIFGIMNSTRLTAPQTYYVNAATGSDSNDGLTTGTAFKTLQKAANQATVFNLNGFSVTVNVADGTYGQVNLPSVNGSGVVNFVGNTAVPANCKIHSNIGPAVICQGNQYVFNGFRFESDAPDTARGQPAAGVWSIPGGVITLGGSASAVVEFGNCADAHMYVNKGVMAPVGSVRICGNSTAAMQATNAGNLYCSGVPYPTLVIPAAQTFTNFVQSDSNSVIFPLFSSMTGKANVSGGRYAVSLNGVVNTAGGGTTYLPGTVAGVTSSGGQYV